MFFGTWKCGRLHQHAFLKCSISIKRWCFLHASGFLFIPTHTFFLIFFFKVHKQCSKFSLKWACYRLKHSRKYQTGVACVCSLRLMRRAIFVKEKCGFVFSFSTPAGKSKPRRISTRCLMWPWHFRKAWKYYSSGHPFSEPTYSHDHEVAWAMAGYCSSVHCKARQREATLKTA